MILSMLWPKLDMEVTRRLDHLLKFPFCVHPGSRKVCVPFFNKDEVFAFDPNDRSKAPVLEDLVASIEEKISDIKEEGGQKDVYSGTAMAEYMTKFSTFLKQYKRY